MFIYHFLSHSEKTVAEFENDKMKKTLNRRIYFLYLYWKTLEKKRLLTK